MTRQKALEMTRFEYNVSSNVQYRSIINSIFDDLEKQTCLNCHYLDTTDKPKNYTNFICMNDATDFGCTDVNTFGCNMFARKI